MTKFVCTSCGGAAVEINPAHPSLDDRYAVGYCDRCTPPVPVLDPQMRSKKPRVRSTVPLIRADLWTPDAIAERDRKRRDKKLVEQATSGRADRLTEAEWDRINEVRRRWQREAEERRSA